MLENGMIVDGKYKILNKIGKGGMSTVYLAMNERANRQWAIKEIQKKGNRYYRTMREELLAETDILKDWIIPIFLRLQMFWNTKIYF